MYELFIPVFKLNAHEIKMLNIQYTIKINVQQFQRFIKNCSIFQYFFVNSAYFYNHTPRM